jgi:hypothetical protein
MPPTQARHAQAHALVTLLLALSPAHHALPDPGPETPPPNTPSFEILATHSWPTGHTHEGVELMGLSGITYDKEKDLFYAISDGKEHPAGKVFSLRLSLDKNGLHAATLLSSTPLLQPDGQPFPSLDAEGIAFDPARRALYVSTEGLASAHDPLARDPWVARFSWPEARLQQQLPLPTAFLPSDASSSPVPPGHPDQAAGVRSNLGLEALGLTPSGTTLYTANEAALLQDHPGTYNSTTLQPHHTPVRIVKFSGLPDDPAVAAQRAYRTEPGHRATRLGIPLVNTVSALLPGDDHGQLIVLERALHRPGRATGSYHIRLFLVDFHHPDATDISAATALATIDFTPLPKSLLWEGDEDLDNFEALTWGPTLDGARTLVLVSDNNASPAQETQLLILKESRPALATPPTPP